MTISILVDQTVEAAYRRERLSIGEDVAVSTEWPASRVRSPTGPPAPVGVPARALALIELGQGTDSGLPW